MINFVLSLNINLQFLSCHIKDIAYSHISNKLLTKFHSSKKQINQTLIYRPNFCNSSIWSLFRSNSSFETLIKSLILNLVDNLNEIFVLKYYISIKNLSTYYSKANILKLKLKKSLNKYSNKVMDVIRSSVPIWFSLFCCYDLGSKNFLISSKCGLVSSMKVMFVFFLLICRSDILKSLKLWQGQLFTVLKWIFATFSILLCHHFLKYRQFSPSGSMADKGWIYPQQYSFRFIEPEYAGKWDYVFVQSQCHNLSWGLLRH